MTIDELLKQRFGYERFKKGQRETIESILNDKLTLSILPTGTGKSLCYQLPSYLLEGATIIISPLVSLMEDQVQQLRRQGEKRVIAINSQLSFQEKKWALENLLQFKFIFFSPETVLQPHVRNQLKKLSIALFVVDEAHCISQWGIDFRPEYEQLQEVIMELSINRILALTATATDKVTADIMVKLFFEQEPTVIRQSVNRPNIAYEVKMCSDKLAYLFSFLETKTGPGIIYFASRKQAEEVAQRLNQQTAQRVAFYHGEMSNQERSIIQQQFLANQLDLLCATSAFGMGVNKPNVRFVIHYHLPASLEAYVQEAGRAGRDGAQSLSVILYAPGDEFIYYHLQQEVLDISKQFQQFKHHSQESIEAFKGQLGDLQEKWLDGYLNQRYTLDELEQALLSKQQEKREQLQQVLNYLPLTSCRREYLLAYFSEELEETNLVCCDNCGNYGKILSKSGFDSEKNLNLSKNWQEKLKTLFIVE